MVAPAFRYRTGRVRTCPPTRGAAVPPADPPRPQRVPLRLALTGRGRSVAFPIRPFSEGGSSRIVLGSPRKASERGNSRFVAIPRGAPVPSRRLRQERARTP
jgi:hypothetical protein